MPNNELLDDTLGRIRAAAGLQRLRPGDGLCLLLPLNMFEAYAASTKPRFEHRREAAALKRQVARAQAALSERSRLERGYRAQRREEHEALLAGPHGGLLARLGAFLEQLTLARGVELPAFVRQLEGLCTAPPEVRQEALHLVALAGMRLREEAGLAPIDDGLPWEVRRSVFLSVKEELGI